MSYIRQIKCDACGEVRRRNEASWSLEIDKRCGVDPAIHLCRKCLATAGLMFKVDKDVKRGRKAK
jgi:hypothetical protein